MYRSMRTPISLLSQAVDFFLRRKRLCIWLVVAFFVGIGISTLFRGGIGPPPRRTDLTVFLRAAEAIQSGEHIYFVANARGWYYVYLPLFAILLTPFTKLPLLVDTFLWYMLSVAALCGTVFLSARLAKDRSVGMRAAVMAALFCVPSLLESMTRGQLGVISVFLAIAILYLYVGRRIVWAGLLFAFAVVLKVSPLAPLVVLFLVKREWKMCAVILLGFFFFVWALPSFVLGTDQNWFFLTEWNRILSHAASDAGHESHIWGQLVTPFDQDNQSLYAVATRWVWPSEEVLISHGNFWVRWASRTFGAVALFMLAFVSRRKRAQTSQKQLMLEYSLFPMLMLLVSPVSEIHHYTILFVMFLPTFLYLDELPKNSVSYQSLMWGALIAAVTHILGYVKPFDYWGFPAIGALVFWCVLFVFLARRSLPDSLTRKPGENL
ncbi:glycosyltransferase family 87 protein [Candidatus Omnitrophota bacterium]